MHDLRPDEYIVNYGNLKPLPDGYAVIWSKSSEMYFGIGPNDEESPAMWDRFSARRWCFLHHDSQTKGNDDADISR